MGVGSRRQKDFQKVFHSPTKAEALLRDRQERTVFCMRLFPRVRTPFTGLPLRAWLVFHMHPRPAGLRKADRDGLLAALRPAFAAFLLVHLLAHIFTRLGGTRFART